MSRRFGAGRRWRWFLLGAVCVLTVAGLLAGLLSQGVVHLNNPSPQRFPVRGVDVSRYQGVIDWPVLAAQDVEFAFIKATEGSEFVDRRFAENLAGATAAGVRSGGYHFFSFDSAGVTQADNVVRTVPAQPGLLPVVVDVEFYGDFWGNPPPADAVRRELGNLLARLPEHYGKPAIIYATAEAYDRYIAGWFPGNDIWIRDVWREPSLSDGRAWTFWQYSDRHRLDGYTGEEQFIDVNVFAGNQDAWKTYSR